jgi:hypothetical protein
MWETLIPALGRKLIQGRQQQQQQVQAALQLPSQSRGPLSWHSLGGFNNGNR